METDAPDPFLAEDSFPKSSVIRSGPSGDGSLVHPLKYVLRFGVFAGILPFNRKASISKDDSNQNRGSSVSGIVSKR
jgi:hypothetical protein